MLQKSSFEFVEYRPSIACVSANTFSIVDNNLFDCLWFIAGTEGFEIVEFKYFICSESPEKMNKEKIVEFNKSVSDRKLQLFLKWIRMYNPTFFSLKSDAHEGWSLVYFDNQLWFQFCCEDLTFIERVCTTIFDSMMLPGKLIFDFVTDLKMHRQEVEVTDFVAVRESLVKEELETLGNFDLLTKINSYGTKHVPVDPKTLLPDEGFLMPQCVINGEGSVCILTNSIEELKGDTLLVFVNDQHEIISPTYENLPVEASCFLKENMEVIAKQMSVFDCDKDLVLIELSPNSAVVTVLMILPHDFMGLELQVRIDITLDLIKRALAMCATGDQIKIHLANPTLDFGINEGNFGPKMMELAVNHTWNNRFQWVFWHCSDLESFSYYQELRNSVLVNVGEWRHATTPATDSIMFF
jgi:hypothetical protein